MRPGGGSSDKGASAFAGYRPEISALSCLWTTLSYSSQWRVATLGLEWGQRSKSSPPEWGTERGLELAGGSGGVRAGGEMQRNGHSGGLFLPVFLKLPLPRPVNCATLSHLLSRRSDKDKEQQPRARETKAGRTLKKYPLILLSGSLAVTVQQTGSQNGLRLIKFQLISGALGGRERKRAGAGGLSGFHSQPQ